MIDYKEILKLLHNVADWKGDNPDQAPVLLHLDTEGCQVLLDHMAALQGQVTTLVTTLTVLDATLAEGDLVACRELTANVPKALVAVRGYFDPQCAADPWDRIDDSLLIVNESRQCDAQRPVLAVLIEVPA